MRTTTLTLSSLVKRCVQTSSILERTRAFSSSSFALQDVQPQSKGIPLAFDFGGINISSNAPFASRLAANRPASSLRTSDTAEPTGRPRPSNSQWASKAPSRMAYTDRVKRSNSNSERPQNNISGQPKQRTQAHRSNVTSSNSPRTSNNSETVRASGSGGRVIPRASSNNIKPNIENRVATAPRTAAQPRNGDASTRTPRRGGVARAVRTGGTQNPSPSGQEGAGRAQRTVGRVRKNIRRKGETRDDSATEARAEMDTKIHALAPSFPTLDRVLASQPLGKTFQPSIAVVGPIGSSSLLQSSSYDKFRIGSTTKPPLVRYPNIVATARLALSRHRGIRFRDRREALRVVRKLAERGGVIAKVQAN